MFEILDEWPFMNEMETLPLMDSIFCLPKDVEMLAEPEALKIATGVLKDITNLKNTQELCKLYTCNIQMEGFP